ncbi:deoxyribodipyrimidine photo-lyase [Neosynechococcus sphagnicola]|uniref:deoxyribodipyrimidine photo-lyase n=1 Tax=Neosynechococcus sphagnicola TaxID=1501145 RepID=UPI000A47ADD1
MSDLILFWHRRDLRIADNLGLAAARQHSAHLVGVFCLDPQILQGNDIAPVRVVYMVGCLQQLQQRYHQLGSQLLILSGHPVLAIPRLATALSAEAVYWNLDVEPYAQSRDRAVEAALQQAGIPVYTQWDQLLHGPESILTGSGQPYTVYTPFWRNWITQAKAEPVAVLGSFTGLTPTEADLASTAGAIALPTAPDLGFYLGSGTRAGARGSGGPGTLAGIFCPGDRRLSGTASFPSSSGHFPAQSSPEVWSDWHSYCLGSDPDCFGRLPQ